MDTSLFHPRPRPGKTPTVLMFYRPETAYRGGAMVERVCQELQAKNPGVRIVTYGGRSPKLGHAVEQMGRVPQRVVAELYSDADVFIECSTFQGFGLQGLEAMASECAVVSTRNLGIDNYGVDGENCRLVDVGDAEAAAAAALDLLDDRNALDSLTAAGMETAQEFDWGEIAARHAEFYRGILDG